MIQVCRLNGETWGEEDKNTQTRENKTTCLHVPFFSHLSLLCNPSPLLPRYHSSPCKLSCSELQRTLLSVELRILSFFNMLASIFLAFSKLCLSSISYLFFKPFPTCSFLQFLHFPNSFLDFLGFSKLANYFFPPVSWLFHNFPPFSSIFPVFLTSSFIFLGFLLPAYLFPSAFRGPRENRTPPSPNCLVVHAHLKKSKWPPLSPPDLEISVHLGNLPTPPILTSFTKTSLPSLSAAFRKKR